MTVLAGLPVIFAIELIPGVEGRAARTAVAAVERSLGLLALLAAMFWLWLARRKQQNPHGSDHSPQARENRGATNGFAPGAIWALVPLLPVVIYVMLLTERAFRALFLVDKDYAGISAALTNTVNGWGILATPYFETGATASYLGHHFSPGLLLFTPFVWAAALAEQLEPSWTAGQRVYGLCLAVAFAGGIWVWGLVFISSVGQRTRLLLVMFLAFAYPLFRLAQSFHYETPVLFFSGLAVLGLRRDNRLLVWLGVIGWSLWKEDLGVYVALFGGVLFLSRATRATGMGIGLFGAAHFVATALILRPWLAGPAGPQWNYLTGILERTPDFGPLVGLICSFGALALFAPRILLVGILPIAILHAWSGHPWHQTYYGHYSYSILPFLLWATADGAANVEWRLGERLVPVLLGALALGLYTAGGEKETPFVPAPPDPHQEQIRALLAGLPANACVQLDASATAQAPLRVFTVPFFSPSQNPLAADFADVRTMAKEPMRFAERCRGYYVLINKERAAPYSSAEEHATIAAQLLSSLPEVSRQGSWVLLRSDAGTHPQPARPSSLRQPAPEK